MAIPYRGVTSNSTYFVTANIFCKQNLLQSERMAELFCELLSRYQATNKFFLHAFVVMPNHIHLLLTIPDGMTLERAMQFVKGRFSFEAGKAFGMRGSIWQKSYLDRRVRDGAECERYQKYIEQNPVKTGLVSVAEDYQYSSLNPRFKTDELPQRLKPAELCSASMHR
jgi:putative transposase